jgi:high affinity sulfate transporter 1
MSASEQPAGWRRYIPIAVWLAAYERGHLAVDLIAALTVWALVVPEAMAYASLAGMPPETGLYAALVAPLAYAIFGTSRQLNVGPSSTVAVLSFAVVAPLAGSDPNLFIQYTTALAILVGAMFIVAGLVKLGFIADFMSKPVLDGFIVGLALTIAAGQLHKLFGIESTGEYADNFFGDIAEVVTNLNETVMVTFVIGAASLALLFILERINEKIPAALVVTFLAIIVVSVYDLTEEGVHVIGEITAGLPSLGWPDIGIGGWVDLVPGAIGIVVVAFAESVAAARTYARKHNYEVDADQEMVALGVANTATGLFGSFTVDGSLSKTAAADQAGQKTQFASIAVSAAVLITILFLTGLFENLPEATLGAIVIHAVWHLINFDKVGRYWNVRRDDFWAGLVGLLGVLIFDILTGLIMAIGVSFLLLLARVSRPYWSVLGRTGDEESDDFAFQSVEMHPDAETFPGLLIIRFDAELFFANATVFADHVHAAIRESDPKPRVVLIDAEAISDIDATALSVVGDLRTELASEGIELWIARLKTRVSEMHERAGGYEGLVTYPTVRAAVQAFLALPGEPEGEPTESDDEARADDSSDDPSG